MVRPTSAGPAGNHDAWLIAGAVALGLAAWGIAYAALTWSDQSPPTNPASIVFGIVAGDVTWSTATTVYAAGLAAAALTVAVVAAFLVRTVRGRPVPVDRAAHHMATRRDVDVLTYKPTSRRARSLAPALGRDAVGLPIGTHLPSRTRLYSSWEDMWVLVAGPRTMKSSTYTIPLALAAPGACLITENKRGVLDHTRGPRAERGDVWVFDPQGVADEPRRFWWNPLSYVTDESRAERLARQIAESTRTAGEKVSYFDDAATTLVAHVLLAAAAAGRPITDAYTWLVTPTDDEPVEILRAHGYVKQAEDLYAKAHLSDRQRDGVYGTAQQVMAFCTNRQMTAWITPSVAGLPQFDPDRYVRSSDTLYALSRDGRGSAGPLVGALTMAVFEAAEGHAATCANGRLPVPLVGLLDEAANVCRLRDLDSKYSHYGSRGIILLTVLQSPDQAEEIWGRAGWRKLWSAANVRVYGGGVANTDFLRELSDLIGSYDHATSSTSSGRGGRTRSRSIAERQVLTVAELGALPRRRAVVLASGTRPTLVKVVPWFERSRSDRAPVELSLAQHGSPGPTDGSAGQPTPAARAMTFASPDVGPEVRPVDRSTIR